MMQVSAMTDGRGEGGGGGVAAQPCKQLWLRNRVEFC